MGRAERNPQHKGLQEHFAVWKQPRSWVESWEQTSSIIIRESEGGQQGRQLSTDPAQKGSDLGGLLWG